MLRRPACGAGGQPTPISKTNAASSFWRGRPAHASLWHSYQDCESVTMVTPSPPSFAAAGANERTSG